MKLFILVLSLCVASVWSQNLLSNLRLNQARRQAEEEEEPAAAAAAPPAPPAPRPQASAPAARQALAGASATAYALPDGADIIVGAIKTTFSCDGRIYGYYADTDNNCQVFHVCVPHLDVENGIEQTIQYSFFCGNQTVFDQESLVCTYPDDAVSCSDAPGLYDQVNRNFGVTDRPPRQRSAGDEPEIAKDADSKDAATPKSATIEKITNGNGKTTLKDTSSD